MKKGRITKEQFESLEKRLFAVDYFKPHLDAKPFTYVVDDNGWITFYNANGVCIVSMNKLCLDSILEYYK